MARERTASSTAIILFADIVDSTALTERMGDAAFRSLARRLDTTLRVLIRRCSGEAIEGKLLGDGVLAVFSSAQRAIDCALQCAAAGANVGLPLHLGVHAGDVIRESNNVYGGAVNIAARIAGASAAGEVLVSDTVRGLARTSADVLFDDRGGHEFKGVSEPMRVFRAQSRRSGISLASLAGRRSNGGSRLKWVAATALAAIVALSAATVAFAIARNNEDDDGGSGAAQPPLATTIFYAGGQAVQLDVVRTEDEKQTVRREERQDGDGRGTLYDGVEPPATSDTSVYESAADLVWLDETKTVIAVNAGVTDSTATLAMPGGARYVLELNGGAADRLGITEGIAINVYTATKLSAPAGTINAEVACLEKEMNEIGHIGRPSLGQDSGLLYNWRQSGNTGWSTVGYLFAIDIIWLDEQKSVIGVAPNVQPGGSRIPHPETMFYALEMTAGAAERFGLVPGTVLAFDVPCDPQ
jgi:class 3 adenylate cyclase/uncharacterized membrane protein (UPF0127 family)